ncbi:hypothetical protein ZWY2020_032552 [Hordeum vulgare]|nr:hypothetical protein ZWY2020_032552 [Hordeum vulgare]
MAHPTPATTISTTSGATARATAGLRSPDPPHRSQPPTGPRRAPPTAPPYLGRRYLRASRQQIRPDLAGAKQARRHLLSASSDPDATTRAPRAQPSTPWLLSVSTVTWFMSVGLLMKIFCCGGRSRTGSACLAGAAAGPDGHRAHVIGVVQVAEIVQRGQIRSFIKSKVAAAADCPGMVPDLNLDLDDEARVEARRRAASGHPLWGS